MPTSSKISRAVLAKMVADHLLSPDASPSPPTGLGPAEVRPLQRRFFVAAPSGAGKSTYALRLPNLIGDVDAAYPRALRDAFDRAIVAYGLKAVRPLRDPLIRAWAATAPHPVVFCHSVRDAIVMGGDTRSIIIVLPPPAVHAARVAARGNTIQPAVALEGYAHLAEEAAIHRLPRANSFDAAMNVVTMMRAP